MSCRSFALKDLDSPSTSTQKLLAPCTAQHQWCIWFPSHKIWRIHTLGSTPRICFGCASENIKIHTARISILHMVAMAKTRCSYKKTPYVPSHSWMSENSIHPTNLRSQSFVKMQGSCYTLPSRLGSNNPFGSE